MTSNLESCVASSIKISGKLFVKQFIIFFGKLNEKLWENILKPIWKDYPRER
jgi:hypothetical protein